MKQRNNSILKELNCVLSSLEIKYHDIVGSNENHVLYLCIIGDEKYKFHFRIEVNFSNNTIGFFNNSIKNIKTDKFNEALQVLNELNNCNAIGTVYLNKEDEVYTIILVYQLKVKKFAFHMIKFLIIY